MIYSGFPFRFFSILGQPASEHSDFDLAMISTTREEIQRIQLVGFSDMRHLMRALSHSLDRMISIRYLPLKLTVPLPKLGFYLAGEIMVNTLYPYTKKYRIEVSAGHQVDLFQFKYEGKRAPGAKQSKAFLHLAGGGYLWDWRLMHSPTIISQLKTQGDVYTLEYTKGPNRTDVLSRSLKEARTAVNFLLNTQGIAPHQLTIWGDSAGGDLALRLLQQISNEVISPAPECSFVLSSPTHFETISEDEIRSANQCVLPTNIMIKIKHWLETNASPIPKGLNFCENKRINVIVTYVENEKAAVSIERIFHQHLKDKFNARMLVLNNAVHSAEIHFSPGSQQAASIFLNELERLKEKARLSANDEPKNNDHHIDIDIDRIPAI